MTQWLKWARRLQSIAQAGLTYAHDVFDKERYQQIREIAAEIAAHATEGDFSAIHNLYQNETGYSTPKIGVRGVVFNANAELLLVKEASTGKWTLPGGWADVWDTPAQAIEREIREESGYETKAVKLLALYDYENQGHPPYIFAVYNIYFLCEFITGEAKISIETSEVGWFSEDCLPEIDSLRTLEKHLHRFFEHYRNPALPTDFD